MLTRYSCIIYNCISILSCQQFCNCMMDNTTYQYLEGAYEPTIVPGF